MSTKGKESPVFRSFGILFVTLSVMLSVTLPMTGCSDVPEHPGEWEEGTSPLGEPPGQWKSTKDGSSSGTGTKTTRNMSNPSSDDTSKTDSGNPVQVLSSPVNETDTGIWVRTEVRTTLTDSDGTSMTSNYESNIDDAGNVTMTEIESDDWQGTISYEHDGYGYRTACNFECDSRIRGDYGETWIPEFECGFLGMISDEKTICHNLVKSDGTIDQSIMNDDSDSVATYSYDSEGRLSRLRTSDGRIEEYDRYGNIMRMLETDPDDPTCSEVVTYDYGYAESNVAKSVKLTYTEQDGDDIDQEEIGNISYERDEHGNITHITVTDVEDEFGYRLDATCEYEYVGNPSKGAKLYTSLDRYSMFF